MGSGDCTSTSEVETFENIPGRTDSNIGPITPDSDRENLDLTVDFDSPPSSDKAFESPQTPQECVFNPFAPGPDEKALAPLCRKYTAKSRSIVARRLSFDSLAKPNGDDDGGAFISDEEIVEAVYENLLETIVSKQTEAILASRDRDQDLDECRTPDSGPRLSGVAETCPGAPLRPGPKSRKVDSSFCRRLQFSP